MDIWTAIAQERRRLANDLDALTDQDWNRPTVCSDWNVKAVAAHLVLPFEVSKPRFALNVIRNRRDVPKTIRLLSAKVDAANTPEQIVEKLRSNADSKWKPPGVGAEVPLGEIVVHAQDIRRATGNNQPVPDEIVQLLLPAIEDPVIRADYAHRIGHQLAKASDA